MLHWHVREQRFFTEDRFGVYAEGCGYASASIVGVDYDYASTSTWDNDGTTYGTAAGRRLKGAGQEAGLTEA